MNCSEAKTYLSDYVEGALNGDLKKRLKEHLRACKRCTEELESLRSLNAALGDLKNIEARSNVFEKGNERISERGPVRVCFHTLFSQKRLALWLELAGGLVVALFVVILSRPAILAQKGAEGSIAEDRPVAVEKAQIPENPPVAYLKKRPPENKVEKRVTEEELPTPSDTTSRESQSVATLSQPEGEQHAIELVLLIRPEAVNLFEIQPREEAFVADEEGREIASPSVKTEKYIEKERAFMLFNTNEKIRELVVNSDGEVVSYSRDKSGLPQSITASIPRPSYNEFLDDLSSFGIFERSDLIETHHDAEMIELAIQFVTTF